jgi:hypothetical protein
VQRRIGSSGVLAMLMAHTESYTDAITIPVVIVSR